jgi:hypothetical protein
MMSLPQRIREGAGLSLLDFPSHKPLTVSNKRSIPKLMAHAHEIIDFMQVIRLGGQAPNRSA